MLLNASKVPGPAEPAGVKGHSSTFAIVGQPNNANVRRNIAITDPAIQNSCATPVESAEGRTAILIAGSKNPATNPLVVTAVIATVRGGHDGVVAAND